MDALYKPPRPRWRGRIHQVAFFVSLPAGTVLVGLAETAVARVAGAVYALSLTALYAASAAYHRITWSPRVLPWMRRLDHSMIYVLIAGTYTPYALLVLRPPWSTVILSLVWAGALLGILLRLVTHRLRALQHVLYLSLGWVALFTLPLTLGRIGWPALALMFLGGILYTAGAILFGLRRPRLRPAVFGYHEWWHSMVAGASLCHYGLVTMLVTGAATP
jgi:hemolysin III